MRELVLLFEEGRERGFKSALAFRRWCRRHNVTIIADGKKRWVRSSDVDAAVNRLAPTSTGNVQAAIATALKGGRRHE